MVEMMAVRKAARKTAMKTARMRNINREAQG
jgi:hypothetical protein